VLVLVLVPEPGPQRLVRVQRVRVRALLQPVLGQEQEFQRLVQVLALVRALVLEFQPEEQEPLQRVLLMQVLPRPGFPQGR
jgi:16S rRNA U1498 N3-methylase RsmE